MTNALTGSPTKNADHHGSRRWQVIIAAIGITLIMFCCSRSRKGEFETIKKRADAHKLQSWATRILKQYPDAKRLEYYPGNATPSDTVILSNPPAFLEDLRIRRRIGPMISTSPAGQIGNRCVFVLYVESLGFGGDGHCIEVGDETFRQATNAQCAEWIPGVYFRYVHSP